MQAEIYPKPVKLNEYLPSRYLIDTVNLTFTLDDERTEVEAFLAIKPNEASKEKDRSLVLEGKDTTLVSIAINGKALNIKEYTHIHDQLIIPNPPKVPFTVHIKNLINPSANTALEGLYKSGNMLCTQNESEGFRHITFFLDRPDVMAVYTTKIIGNKKQYPLLLSNGNCIDKGDMGGGMHFAVWKDPFPKPCYLFALVAGDLGSIRDSYTTKSGRKVSLVIYCDHGNEKRCEFAMYALKKSMEWDEKVYGLEYDLDIFMIVAVDAFNFGAMENKGLNIFNTSCLLASDKTETDVNFERVLEVVAHEYFHNWTGNRVTCRDWFQLTLKEGLTVFRDQEFSSDMLSRPVKRIEEVNIVRSKQFPEDAGPMAHPIQPKEYFQINNFYTNTVYRKGAEVIRMIHTLIGPEKYRKGIDKYFEKFDGMAVTTDQFIEAMEEGSGFDLKSQFTRWYHQAGTPNVFVKWAYNEAKKEFKLDIEQSTSPTADGSKKEPFYFPFAIALLGSDGKAIPIKTPMLHIKEQKETFIFENVKEKPVVSLNRNFTAPVQVHAPYEKSDYAFLMKHDTDPFNRYDAGHEFMVQQLLELSQAAKAQKSLVLDSTFVDAYIHLLDDKGMDGSLKALSLVIPSESILGDRQEVIAIDENFVARQFMENTLSLTQKHRWLGIYQENHKQEKYVFDSKKVAQRALKNFALSALVASGDEMGNCLAYEQFTKATHMTDEYGALYALCKTESKERDAALAAYHKKWKGDKLAICKWFALQATSSSDNVIEQVRRLAKDEAFDLKIPNIARALYEMFTLNTFHFNTISGEGYALITDVILELDNLNPNVASRIASAYGKVGKLDVKRQKLMHTQMERVMAKENLSTGVREIVEKTLQSLISK